MNTAQRKRMTQKKKLNIKQLDSIKEQYMAYKSISELATAYDVTRNTITYHINYGSWKAERKLKENELFASFDDGKKVDFVEMTNSTVQIMSRALKHLATRHEPPTMSEASRTADILKTLDNILRLDEGKPTDIVESSEKPISETDLREKLKADPFSKTNKEEKDTNEKLN